MAPRERMVRVKEEFKHQRELMREGFERVDKRFWPVDKCFERPCGWFMAIAAPRR